MNTKVHARFDLQAQPLPAGLVRDLAKQSVGGRRSRTAALRPIRACAARLERAAPDAVAECAGCAEQGMYTTSPYTVACRGATYCRRRPAWRYATGTERARRTPRKKAPRARQEREADAQRHQEWAACQTVVTGSAAFHAACVRHARAACAQTRRGACPWSAQGTGPGRRAC